ncbi:MAG: hypothetical protein ACLFQX_00425 [Candidatus Kapaibacterium sp.]
MIKLIRINILIIAILALGAINARAQGGSNYSMFGVGDLFHDVSASYKGLGGTSIAFPSENSINTRNPAMWSFVTTTRLQAGYVFNQHYIQQEPNELLQNNGQVNNILGLFSIDTALGIAVSFGIHPQSTVNYLVAHPVSINIEGVTANGRTLYRGAGGLSSAYVGVSTGIIGGLYVGGSVYASFGKIERMTLTEFYRQSAYDQIFDYELDERDFFSGFGWKAGMAYRTSGFTFGAFFESQPSLSAERNEVHYSSLQRDTSFTSEFDLAFPAYYGFGAAYETGKFIMGADLSFQDFSGFDYKPGVDTRFTNSMMMSAGVERIGSKSPGAKFIDRIAYKFGLGYNQLYYEVAGNHIDEYFGAVGMQIPLGSDAVIDAGLMLGSRGTTDNGLIREYFGRFNLDISIGDVWFRPYRRY